MAADGPDTALWTFGLVLIGPYVIHADPDAAAEARVLKAMAAVERALGQTDCAHEEHPCDEMPDDDELDSLLDSLLDVLEMLARPEGDVDDESDNRSESRTTREIWACPRNVAGFAREFSQV